MQGQQPTKIPGGIEPTTLQSHDRYSSYWAKEPNRKPMGQSVQDGDPSRSELFDFLLDTIFLKWEPNR